MDAFERPEPAYPVELATRVPFELAEPCAAVVHGLRCDETEGELEVHPFATSSAYGLRCANGHAVRMVSHAEVRVRFGIPDAPETRTRHALEPSRRCRFNVLLRDGLRCVFCGRSAGERDLQGFAVTVAAHPIVPRDAIDPADLKHDRELRALARDGQLVTCCADCHAAAERSPLGASDALATFVRCVLQGRGDGRSAGVVSLFERLYRLAERHRRRRLGGEPARR